ncbi:MAG: chloride channel protein [Hyphomicrobiaceae bacterium]|nr:chloride channel protein [Hyphomicrobiaceae bacterium]
MHKDAVSNWPAPTNADLGFTGFRGIPRDKAARVCLWFGEVAQVPGGEVALNAKQFLALGWTSIRGWVRPNLVYVREHRLWTLWFLAAGIGLGTSLAAVLFREAIAIVQWPWLGTMSENIASAARALDWWMVLLVPGLGGLIVGLLLTAIQPGRRAGGVADVIEAKLDPSRALPFTPGLSSAAITALGLGFGASAGREGPVVHLGATLAATLGRAFNLPPSAQRTLLACGVAGAVSASFNAPIAGVLFAHEVILGHYAISAFVPIVIASVTGTLLSRIYFGDIAAFSIPAYQITSYWEFPAFALLGIVCALVAIIFQFALIGTDFVARNVRMPLWMRPAIGGLLVGAIALWFPQVLGVGYQPTDLALRNQLPLDLLFMLLIAKTAATAITLASRFGGGIFSPSLYLGAMAGGAFGLIAGGVFPEMASSEGLYAILGMGAVAAAVLGAPVSTTMIIFELTGGYALSLALLLTVSIANGISQAVHGRSYFHWQLEARGIAVSDGPHAQLMRQIRVRAFMDRLDGDDPPEVTEDMPFLTAEDTLEHALRLFDEHGTSRLPVIESKLTMKVTGHALQVRALRHFNEALIDTSVEEHR